MKNKFLRCVALFVGLSALLLPAAYADSEAFALCAQHFPSDATARLKCFDDALSIPVASTSSVLKPVMVQIKTQPHVTTPDATNRADLSVRTAGAEPQSTENPPELRPSASSRSYLTRVWNLDNRTHRNVTTLDRLQPHRQSYLIISKSSNPNNMPGSPAIGHSVQTPRDMDALEAKFQLSFKDDFMTVENINLWDLKTFRLWGAYTQQSHWQVFNTRNSSPFRETNYEPELIASFGTGRASGWKLLNLGFEHQSNGRPLPDSRSWNRVYVQGGWEWDNISLLARGWYRIPEKVVKDDNPDISHYIGRADMVARWEPESKSQAVSFLLRNNLNLNANFGFMEFDWSIPVTLGKAARLHAQISSGYGESLIDYNHRQTTMGLGISFREW